jgi:hypothetical protein
MADKSLFPMVTQFGFDPGESTNPDLHLVFTIWIECTDRRIVIPVNSAPHSLGQRLAYMVFEATDVMQAGLAAYRLVEVSLTRPENLSLSSYQQVFSVTDPQQCAQAFLTGIVPHA